SLRTPRAAFQWLLHCVRGLRQRHRPRVCGRTEPTRDSQGRPAHRPSARGNRIPGVAACRWRPPATEYGRREVLRPSFARPTAFGSYAQNLWTTLCIVWGEATQVLTLRTSLGIAHFLDAAYSAVGRIAVHHEAGASEG